MIDLERFNVLVTHDNCADGVASAMIATARANIEVIFCNYNDHIHRSLKPADSVLWVDMTPHGDMLEGIEPIPGACIDHHSTAENICSRFALHVFRKERRGVCGCSLLLDSVDPLPNEVASVRENTIVGLVSIYDSWDTANPSWDRACQMAAALKMWPLEDLLNVWADEPVSVGALLACGKGILRQQEARLETLAKGARYLPRLKWAIVQANSADTSMLAERLAKEGTAYVTVGFTAMVRDGERGYRLSIRSALTPDGSQEDVGAIAKRHGGGGHPASAMCWVAADRKDPWTQILEVLGA